MVFVKAHSLAVVPKKPGPHLEMVLLVSESADETESVRAAFCLSLKYVLTSRPSVATSELMAGDPNTY